MPRRVRDILALQGGPTQCLAGGFNIKANQRMSTARRTLYYEFYTRWVWCLLYNLQTKLSIEISMCITDNCKNDETFISTDQNLNSDLPTSKFAFQTYLSIHPYTVNNHL